MAGRDSGSLGSACRAKRGVRILSRRSGSSRLGKGPGSAYPRFRPEILSATNRIAESGVGRLHGVLQGATEGEDNQSSAPCCTTYSLALVPGTVAVIGPLVLLTVLFQTSLNVYEPDSPNWAGVTWKFTGLLPVLSRATARRFPDKRLDHTSPPFPCVKAMVPWLPCESWSTATMAGFLRSAS